MNVYTGNFKNLKNETIQIIFLDSMESSNTYELTFGPEPCTIEVEAKDGIYSPLVTKSCSIQIVAPTPYFNLYSSKWNATSVQVTNLDTSQLLFDGFVTPCLYSQPFVNDSDTTTIECIDKISSLESINYSTIEEEEKLLSVVKVLMHICEPIGITKILFLNTLINADSSAKTLETFLLNERNFCEDIEKHQYWSNKEVLYEIAKFFGLSAYQMNEDTIIMYDVSSYKVFDTTNWFGNNNFTLATFTNNHTEYTLEAYSLNLETFYVDKDDFLSNDCNISLDEVYKRVSVLASTNVDDESSDDSSEDDEDLMAGDGVISKYVTYFKKNKENVYNSALYVKVVKLKNWELHIWAHAGGNGPLYELSAPGSSDDVVGKDFKNLRWMDGLHRENSVFHWANSMYGALIKTMLIDYKNDVSGDFNSCLALGFGMVGSEYYTNPGSNGSKKQENFWNSMKRMYDLAAGQYELMTYKSKKNRVWHNDHIEHNSDDDAYYILFNGTVRMTAIAANGMIRNSLTEMTRTNFPMIYDEKQVFWRKKIEDKFAEDAGKRIWFNTRILEILDRLGDETVEGLVADLGRSGYPVIAFKLKVGDKWWDSETKTWTTQEKVSWMNVGLKNLYVEDDMEISNNIMFAEGIEESGWGIPVRNSDNLSGPIEFTFMNPAFNVPASVMYANHYHEALIPCCLMIKDFKIDYLEVKEDGYWWKEEDDVTEEEGQDKTKDRSEDDTEYYYEIDDNFYNEYSPWEMKINTLNMEKSHSYSSVIFNDGENGGYLLKLLNACSSNTDYKFAEEWMAEKLGKHYRSPKKKLEMTIDGFVDPMRPIIYRTASKDQCCSLSQSFNTRTDENSLTFCEIGQ